LQAYLAEDGDLRAAKKWLNDSEDKTISGKDLRKSLGLQRHLQEIRQTRSETIGQD
jgi:uncharacterized protein YidB (DUF937 family)